MNTINRPCEITKQFHVLSASLLLMLLLLADFAFMALHTINVLSASLNNKLLYLILLIGVLAFFGVFVDMLDIAIKINWIISAILTVVEDGGEMLVTSTICWYLFMLSVRDEHSTVSIVDFIFSPLIKRFTI
jgi:hypothetical protein